MEAHAVRFERSGAVTRCEAAIHSEATRQSSFTVRFDFDTPLDTPETSGDPWLAALLLPAMFSGEPLEIRAAVSERLLRRAADAQTILSSWWPGFLKKVPIVARQVLAVPARPEDSGPTASFFSGGVDSWYTLQKHNGTIRQLLTVKGFDLPFNDREVWPEIVRANREIAADLGKELVCVETNIRDRLDPSYGCFHRPFFEDFWGQCMHGACMAAVGLMLESRIARAIIPASMEYSFLPPWGSHPLLDPLWSNGRVRFVHDGCEELRLEKVRAIAELDPVLRWLRVCPACRPGRYNCGVCEKCQRTMITLRLFGVLDRATCFDRRIDFDGMELYPLTPIYFPTYREILREAVEVGDTRVEHLVRVLLGEKRSFRRDRHRARTALNRVTGEALRVIGVPRWKRSIRKRVERVRRLADRTA